MLAQVVAELISPVAPSAYAAASPNPHTATSAIASLIGRPLMHL
jgi:hypothetical protein